MMQAILMTSKEIRGWERKRGARNYNFVYHVFRFHLGLCKLNKSLINILLYNSISRISNEMKWKTKTKWAKKLITSSSRSVFLFFYSCVLGRKCFWILVFDSWRLQKIPMRNSWIFCLQLLKKGNSVSFFDWFVTWIR